MWAKRIGVLLAYVLVVGANTIDEPNATTSTDTVTETTVTSADVDNTTASSLSNSYIAEDLEEKLYNYIITRDFTNAVDKSLSMHNAGLGHVIRKVIDRLVDEGNSVIFDYSCKFREAKEQFFVAEYMYLPFRIQEKFAKLVDARYGWTLTYGNNIDSSGDKRALGINDITATAMTRIAWWFDPTWVDNKLFFKMRTAKDRYYLKLGSSRNEDGDYTAFGDKKRDSDRHLWYLKPVRHNDAILVYIINKEFNSLLKFGQSTEYDGYRVAYGHSTWDLNPEKFAWAVR